MNEILILHLEDGDLDADLIRSLLATLRQACVIDRVTSGDAFVSAISSRAYHIILADYQLPDFDGLLALDLAQKVCPRVPFIFVSGVLGEEVAIESLKRGATDYVVKQRMDRLVPAVQRALKEARVRAEREEAEVELRGSEERLLFVLEAGRLGSWELDLATGTLTCSDTCKANYGKEPGDRFEYADLVACIHPVDRDRVRDSLTATAAAERGDDYEAEYRVLRPDGALGWVFVRGRVEHAADGRPFRVRGISLDITERKQAETAVRHSEEAARRRAAQLQALAAASTRLNAALDVDSVLRVVTTEARTLIGAHQSLTCLSSERDRSRVVTAASCSAERQGVRSRQDLLDDPHFDDLVCRSNRPLRLTQRELEAHPAWPLLGEGDGVDPPRLGWLAAPLIGPTGKNFGFIRLLDRYSGEFSEDDESILVQLAHMASVAIENARLYDELRENDRRKDEFLAMLAHELRNPLAAINSAVHLTQTSRLQEHIEWSMEVVNRQIRHLTRLIDDLLDVSRITRGKIELRMDRLDPSPVVASAVQAVRPLVEERQHQLAVSVQPGLCVRADPVRLEQILTNLLTNAAKYTECGGTISLEAQAAGRVVEFRIRDNGIGIPPEALPTMFELFAQGDRTLARSEGGLGIGLTLVKTLTELHGGTIEAKSQGRGEGSEFVVRLPSVDWLEPQAPPDRAEPPEAARGRARILVVDDNVDMTRGLARLLALLGHEVTTAHDGPSALEAARTQEPGFILLDIGLPGMSGYEVAEYLRREGCCPGAVIVAVSGYGQEDDRRRSREAGFDHHLVKPIDHNALMQLLASGGNGSGNGRG